MAEMCKPSSHLDVHNNCIKTSATAKLTTMFLVIVAKLLLLVSFARLSHVLRKLHGVLFLWCSKPTALWQERTWESTPS